MEFDVILFRCLTAGSLARSPTGDRRREGENGKKNLCESKKEPWNLSPLLILCCTRTLKGERNWEGAQAGREGKRVGETSKRQGPLSEQQRPSLRAPRKEAEERGRGKRKTQKKISKKTVSKEKIEQFAAPLPPLLRSLCLFLHRGRRKKG